ncbi:VWA domain-containing protein [Ferrimonas balearica]|uniref:VWA domain-containing protein n=1 Tax=Ferrimonas balearica TaxID=44012 RepID=UPI001C99717F|nr:VWA domain-containing protein [Ferrimonas balearica]MBY5992959.1 VWA domain-containing protein [Ferrimonas balearica]
MAELHLVRPWALLLILLLPLLWWLLMRREAQAGVWQRLLPRHLQAAMLDGEGQSGKGERPLWLCLGLLLAILALAGPSWDKQEVPLYQLGQGRVLVIDLSFSMWATDLPPNRMTQARFKATDLLRQAKEGEMALVVYGGDAFTLAPLTEDRATLLNLLPALSPEIMPVPGSNLPAALTQADTLLRDAGYQQGEIVLLIDDLLPEHAEAAMDLARSQPWQLKILALGTAEGSPMQTPNGELIRGRDGSVALARTNFDLLERLAEASGGRLVRYRPGSGDIDALLDPLTALDAAGGANRSEQQHSQWRDRGGQLLVLALLPLAWALRRQALLALLPLALWLAPPPAQAAWWQTDDQKAKDLFDQGQFAEAAEQFDSPAWRGSAHYRAGQYQQALDAFEQAEGVDALYNQGNALAQLQRYPEAAERYRQVLAQQPEHQQAKDNLAWVEAQQPPPQDSDSAGEQGKDGEEQPEQSGDQPSQNGEQSDQSGSDDAQDAPPTGNSESPSDAQESASPEDPATGEGESQTPPQPQPQDQQQGEPANDPHGDRAEEATPPPTGGESKSEAEPDAQASAAQMGDGDLGEEQLQQLLNQVPDDPARLLRNKMELEYERRRQNGTINTERTQW